MKEAVPNIMKKEVPNIIKIEMHYESKNIESILYQRSRRILDKGYGFSNRDYNIYAAIIIRNVGIDKMPVSFQKKYEEDPEFKTAIQFEMSAIALEQSETLNQEQLKQHVKSLLKRAELRKAIVAKEVTRTGQNFNKINFKNSIDYRTLLDQIKDFDDLTLIDWFVPIELTYERFVHIYVKHVTETKFGDAKFKKRTFFDYRHTELLTLIKAILKQEELDIKEHFLNNVIAKDKNEVGKIKDYHRGFGKFRAIELGGDQFSLSIDKSGKITKFHQI